MKAYRKNSRTLLLVITMTFGLGACQKMRPGEQAPAEFVGWTDLETKEALMIIYSEGNSNNPGRYDYYELSNIYTIIRAEEE